MRKITTFSLALFLLLPKRLQFTRAERETIPLASAACSVMTLMDELRPCSRGDGGGEPRPCWPRHRLPSAGTAAHLRFPSLPFPSHRETRLGGRPRPLPAATCFNPPVRSPPPPLPAGGGTAMSPKKYGTRRCGLIRGFCPIKSVYMLVRSLWCVLSMLLYVLHQHRAAIPVTSSRTVSNTSPWISLGQGVMTVRLMHSYPGLSSLKRTARCQRTPCGPELVTSGGEKGLPAAVRQECDSTDTSECLDESWGVYTQL